MDVSLNQSVASAEALAVNFQVSELEPWLENAWPGGQLDQGPKPANPGGV